MALISLDFPGGSVGLYGTNKALMLDGLYAQIGATDFSDTSFVSIVDDPDPNITGNVFRCNANSYGGGGNRITMREVLPNGVTTTVHIASRMWLSRLPANSSEIPLPAIWKDGSNNRIAELRVSTTGVITAHDAAGSQIGTTTLPVVTANAWHHIEGQLTCSTSSLGTLTVWVNGAQKMALTGLNMAVSGTSQIERGVDPSGTSSNPAVYFKDTVLQDSTGSQNNSQIGPLPVIDITEDGDVSSGWVSTAATNYGAINESPPVDSSYIEADATLPAPSIMTMTDLPADIVGVRGLVIYTRGWNVDSGDGRVQPGLSPDGTNWDDGSDHILTTSATYYRDVSELSPATAAPWTPIEVNNAEIRFNRTV